MSHLQLITSHSGGDFPGITFRQARHFRIGRRGFEACYIVTHCAECSEVLTAAESLQRYAETMSDVDEKGRPRRASWTFACDADSTTQSVKLKDTAFHAPPLNDMSVGIELAGWARQLDSDWGDAFSRRMLAEQLAPLMARVSHATGIPQRPLDDEALRLSLDTCNRLARRGADPDEWRGFKSHACGIVTHAQVARVFRKSVHTDPGKAFPFDTVIEMARAAFDALPPA